MTTRRWIYDNPNGPSQPKKWHSAPDCPSIIGAASEVDAAALPGFGLDPGPAGKCGLCARREAAQLRAFRVPLALTRQQDEVIKVVGPSLGYDNVALFSTSKLEKRDRDLVLVPTDDARRFRLIVQDAGGWEEDLGVVIFNVIFNRTRAKR